jgi:large subunit ribosomal protein L6
MSRVGKNPISIPSGITADVKDQDVKIKGPKGEMTLVVHPKVEVKMEAGSITVAPRTEDREACGLPCNAVSAIW